MDQTSHNQPSDASREAADAAAPHAIYADDRVAVEAVWKTGVPRSTPVRTSSPGLLALPDIPGEAMDKAVPPARIREIEDAALDISEALFHAALPARDRAVAAIRATYSSFHLLLLKAAALRPEDFAAPVAVGRVAERGANDRNLYFGILGDVLGRNPNAEIVDVEASGIEGHLDVEPPAPGFFARLRYANVRTPFYRAMTMLGGRRWFPGLRGRVLVLRENELVKEAAAALALRGFALERIDFPRISGEDQTEAEKLGAAAAGIARERLAEQFSAPVLDVVADHLAGLVTRAVARYENSLEAWRRRLDGLSRRRPRAILTNFLSDPAVVGMYTAARERGIAVVTVQHGVTMEIHERARRYHGIHENAASDLALVFNRRASAALERSPFGTGRTAVVGLPSEYGRRGRADRQNLTAPIWYVSTSLYFGNQGLLNTGVADVDKATFEQMMVEDLLASLPHRVLYKPYPGLRYLDPDPVVEAARRAANIDVYEGRLDLRYIVGNARVLITSRSYSTPSWCIMTGKPLVHIDIPDQAPFTPDARKAFEKGVFLFDAGSDTFHDDLRDLLSLPIDEIEARYREMAPAREKLIDEFICDRGGRAGPRAARAITSVIGDFTDRGPA